MSGFTNIPNQIWDWIIDNKQLSNQTRILAMVIRFTVCFKRQFHNLSLSFIANRLEMQRQNVNRDIQAMIDSGLIREMKQGQNRLLAINCDMESVIKNDYSVEESVIKNDDSTVIKNDYTTVIKSDYQEIKQSKLKKNKDVHDDLFNEFWMAYPRKEGKADARKAFDTAINKDAIETILSGVRGYAQLIQNEKRELKYVKLPAGWLRSELWRDYIVKPQQESQVIRLIKAQQTENDGDNIARLQRAYEQRREQAGFS